MQSISLFRAPVSAASLLLAIFAMILCPVPVTCAQQAGVPDAQTQFDLGQKAYARSSFEEALEHFDHSYRAKPSARTLLRIAETAQAAGRRERAIDSYKAYLVAYPNAPKRAAAEAKLAALQANPQEATQIGSGVPVAAQGASAGVLGPSKSRPQFDRTALSRASSQPWSADDEAWYRRNRFVRVASGAVAAFGALMFIGSAAAANRSSSGVGCNSYDSSFGACQGSFGGLALYVLGSTTLAASTLYGVNEIRRRGVRVSKVSAVLSVVGLFGPPMLWIAAPMAGANMRRAHDGLGVETPRSTADWLPSLQYRTRF
jgi:tetratricopeptide (TPR) repeat protein